MAQTENAADPSRTLNDFIRLRVVKQGLKEGPQTFMVPVASVLKKPKNSVGTQQRVILFDAFQKPSDGLIVVKIEHSDEHFNGTRTHRKRLVMHQALNRTFQARV
jgi:hypothetical protein